MKDCMKLISSMSEEERKEYFEQIGMAVDTVKQLEEKTYEGWSADDRAKYDGVVFLLSAYSYARSFTKQDKAFKPEKRMAMVKMYLKAIVKKYNLGDLRLNDTAAKSEMNGSDEDAVAKVDEGDNAEAEDDNAEKLRLLVKMYGDSRPKHFDEWSEFMSAGLKKKADSIEGLYVQLGDARRIVEELSKTSATTEEERSKAAKTLTKIDNKIGAIYKLANKEWDELVESVRK